MANLLFDGFEVLSTTYLNIRWDITSLFGNGMSTATSPVRLSSTQCASKTSQSFSSSGVRSIGTNVGHVFVGVGFLVGSLADQPGSGTLNQVILYDGTTAQVSWRVNADGSISVYRGNGTSATLIGTTATGVIVNGSTAADYKMVEMEVVFATGATGSVTLRVAGVQVLNVTSVQTSNTANAYCNRVGLAADQNLRCKYDDLYVNDNSGSAPHNTFYGEAFNVERVLPNADGASTQWTRNTGANNWAAVDDNGNDDTDYVSDATVGHVDSYGCSNLAAATSSTVVGVEHYLIAKKDDIATREIRGIWRVSGTNYPLTTRTMTGTYQNFRERVDTNPGTSLPWSVSDINALEIGVEVVT